MRAELILKVTTTLLVPLDFSKMLLCPFPAPDLISPCRCYGDSSYRIHLICHLQTDLQADLLSIISRSFSCKPIHRLEFNLGGHRWLAGFSGEHFSNLLMEKVIIRKARSVEGEWFLLYTERVRDGAELQ